jgi:hypothetical protein
MKGKLIKINCIIMSNNSSASASPFISETSTGSVTITGSIMAYPSATASSYSTGMVYPSSTPSQWTMPPSPTPYQWSITPSPTPSVSHRPSIGCIATPLPDYLVLVDRSYFIYGGIILGFICIGVTIYINNLYHKNEKLQRQVSLRERPDTHSHVNTLFTAISNRQV